MTEFLASPIALSLILFVLIVGGALLIRKVRASSGGKVPPASDWLTKFKDLHAQGELSDEEYRTIKSMLAERLQQQINSKDETR